MRLKFTLCMCSLLLAGPVLADPVPNAEAANACGWTAHMEDDEGGPTFVASSCENDTASGPAFRLICGDEINMRYYGFEMDAGLPPLTTLALSSGGKSLNANVVYEEMDGALAADIASSSSIISLLKAGDEVGVTLHGADVPTTMVSLKGSSAAIEKLIRSCR